MSSTSRTGLIPTPKKSFKLVKKRKAINEGLPVKFEAFPMALSLRPFGGLYNPFAKGCSVLCNHPAPTEVKYMINQFKSTLAIEGKAAQIAKERLEIARMHETDNIPEDLFRRYTDTDSRPLTPSPTVTSVHTRTSAGSFLNNRRCITPEFGKNENIKRKKIILDLRRSHSQETLYWKPSSDMSQSAADGDSKPKSAGTTDEKKAKHQQKSAEQRPKSSLATAATTEEGATTDEGKKAPRTCINDHDLDDENVRRGKKRKKIKPTPATTTFHLSEDPETQVATLGPDSMNPSTRPSLIPNSVNLLPNKDRRDSEPLLLKGSYLTDDVFQTLKTELDVDVIENTFGRYLNRALREAIKYVPPKPASVSKVAEQFEELSLETKPNMPRKFSKSATRFDVPLNLKSLEKMTVFDYLRQYVWVMRQRKQLYKRVFLQYLNKSEASTEAKPKADEVESAAPVELPLIEYIERTIPMADLPKALKEVLGFHGTERNVSQVLRLLSYDELKSNELDFRSWCGIVSFAERLALSDPTDTDSCDELEKADFSSMEQRIGNFKVSNNLRQVFEIIRRAHNL